MHPAYWRFPREIFHFVVNPTAPNSVARYFAAQISCTRGLTSEREDAMDEQLLAKRYRDDEKYKRAVERGMRLGRAINRLREQLPNCSHPVITRIRTRHA